MKGDSEWMRVNCQSILNSLFLLSLSLLLSLHSLTDLSPFLLQSFLPGLNCKQSSFSSLLNLNLLSQGKEDGLLFFFTSIPWPDGLTLRYSLLWSYLSLTRHIHYLFSFLSGKLSVFIYSLIVLTYSSGLFSVQSLLFLSLRLPSEILTNFC